MLGDNDGFVNYLANAWDGQFEHSYSVTGHRSWAMWRKNCPKQDSSIWYCSNLAEAAHHYSWSGSDCDFPRLSSCLIGQIQQGDNSKTEEACMSILSWGGVGRGKRDRSRQWINEQCAKGTLCEQLIVARDLLINHASNLSRFDGVDLLMNSAMTKIYAASAPEKLIIYDGRVGAALGLLAREYLASNESGHLPCSLKFGWGASRPSRNGTDRNPSKGELKFPRLFGSGDRAHAEMMRGASKMLMKVVNGRNDEKSCTLQRLERSLFMIGYDARQLTH